MKKIWLILIFLLNLTPNISNGTFTLTGMNKMFAQLGVNEFICEDEFGESFDSSVPCDMIACVSTCQTCGEQGICEDDHVCPDVECETCGEFYPAGGFHECSSIRCSQCGIDYYPVKGHYCTGGNEGSGGNESENEGDNSSGNGQGNTPVVPPYTPPSTPVNPPTPSPASRFIDGIYSSNSSLTNSQKEALINAVDNMMKNASYNKLLNYLAERGLDITFIVNLQSQGRANYNPTNSTLSFSSDDYITSAILREEFIHILQSIIYENTMTAKYKNYEMEAQIIADMIYQSDNTQATVFSTSTFFYHPTEEHLNAYNRLINKTSSNVAADFETICDIYFYQTGNNVALDCDPDFYPNTYLWFIE